MRLTCPLAPEPADLPVRKDCSVPGKVLYVLWRTNFEIDEKYLPIKAIGKGAYGVVCSAKNQQTGEKIAIKKIGQAFENLTDARRTLREIKLLRHLRHENIIAVRDILLPPAGTKDKYNDVYIVYELMDTDLHQVHPPSVSHWAPLSPTKPTLPALLPHTDH